ncbi:MAG: ABC-type molybdate transporter, permease protein [Pseudomonadota bacterium]
MSSVGQRLALIVAGSVLVLFLAVPMVVLLTTTTSAEFASGMAGSLVWPALRLSLFTTLTSLTLTVLFGTPLAWTLAKSSTRLGSAVETLVQLPMVVPPAVAGVALLLTFGRRGVLCGWLYPRGSSVTFTTAAVVLAELFVSAPFFVQAATSAFRLVDRRLLVVAQTMGASPLRVLARIAAPLAMPGLVAGAVMTWARSLGEFGATLMFAGNLEGRTQTLPLAIYTALEGNFATAQALSIVLVIVAFALLLATRALVHRRASAEGAS